jgi:hypothetical protein
MREPKFSDAPCYGKKFDAKSKICHVCLANRSCQHKCHKRVSKLDSVLLVLPASLLSSKLQIGGRTASPWADRHTVVGEGAVLTPSKRFRST